MSNSSSQFKNDAIFFSTLEYSSIKIAFSYRSILFNANQNGVLIKLDPF